MKVAIIGAGWAGLSAALRLQSDGHQPVLLEAAPGIGGRARGVASRKLGLTLDNGQHILLSAYTETLALLHSLHDGLDAHCAMLPLVWETADGSLSLRVPEGLPGGLALGRGVYSRLLLGWGLASAHGLSLNARWRAAQALARLALSRWRVAGGLTVEQWLDEMRQPAGLRERFWRPLCLATTNTPTDQACAQLFAHVLRDSLGQGAHACRIVLPRIDLGSLWDSPALRRLDIRLGHPVRQIEWRQAGIDTAQSCHDEPEAIDAAQSCHGEPETMNAAQSCRDKSGAVDTAQSHRGKPEASEPGPESGGHAARPLGGQTLLIDGEPFDAVIVATSSTIAHKLLQRLPPCPGDSAYLAPFAAMTHLPIATLYLRLAGRWPLPRPMLQLREAPERRWFGQWVFDRAAFSHDGAPVLSVVISDARTLAGHDEAAILEGVREQLRAQLERAGPMPSIESHQLIVEKRATFAATPGLPRPRQQTPWPGVVVAGDWTDTGYPAVLEGAVRSGLRAAELSTFA